MSSVMHELGMLRAPAPPTSTSTSPASSTTQAVDAAAAPRWPLEKVTFKVDSGAHVTVTRTDQCQWHRTFENELSRVGGGYRAANKGFVKDRGTKYLVGKLAGQQGSEQVRRIKSRVANVSRNLLSVRQCVEANQRVVFDSEACGGSYIEEKGTGERFPISVVNGAYEITMSVFDEESGRAILGQQSPTFLAQLGPNFHRQGGSSL